MVPPLSQWPRSVGAPASGHSTGRHLYPWLVPCDCTVSDVSARRERPPLPSLSKHQSTTQGEVMTSVTSGRRPPRDGDRGDGGSDGAGFRGSLARPQDGQQLDEIMTYQKGVAVGAFLLAFLVMTFKAVAVGAILVAFLVGFGDHAAPIESPTSKVSPSSSTVAAPKPVPFTPNYRYPDGLELAITQITHAKLDGFRATDDPNAKPGDPYTIVTVTLRNGSHHEVEAAFVGTTTLWSPEAGGAPGEPERQRCWRRNTLSRRNVIAIRHGIPGSC